VSDTLISTTQESVSRTLARWLATVRPGDVPGDVRLAATNTLIDVLGLCLAARHADYTRATLTSWDGRGPCSVIGLPDRLDAAGAALVNGTAAHGEDFDNTFEGCPVHSGAVVVPAVLAIAEREHLSGERALLAIAVGLDVMCRLGMVAQKGVHSAGFHPTAVLGVMAAAAAVGVALGLSEDEFVNTFGVGGSMASGIIEYLADGSWTKRMHAGWAAHSGIRAVQMGRNGFVGPGTVFEGTHGLFNGFAPSLKPDFGHLIDDLGRHWEAARLAFKPYACGTMTQPYIDCAIALRNEGIAPEDIADMVCDVGEGTVHRLWEPLADKQSPPTPYAAKFSTPYCVAVGLVCGDAGLAEFTPERLRDPRVLAAAAKVGYRIDPQNEYPRNYSGHIRATLKDGRVVEKTQATLRGGERQPLPQEELIAKFQANARFGGWPDAAATRLLRFALALDQVDDVAVLGEVLGDGKA